MQQFKKTLAEVAKIIDGEVVGNKDIVVTGLCGIKEAKDGDLTFVDNLKYVPLIDHTHAAAIITSREITSSIKPIIQTDNPSLAFAKMVSLVSPSRAAYPKGIHSTAVLGKDVKLGKDVAIGPYVIIEDKVKIGDNSIISAGCCVGYHSRIGNNTLIYPNVSILEGTIIGNQVIVHSGSVLGSDGFGFILVRGIHEKIPQIGIVLIEDNVEIGANVAIDRARLDKTIIGKGTKIDNLVHIAHNVVIGENSIVVAQVGISGSAIIGKGVIIAGQAGVSGHVTVGDGSVVAGRAGVTKSIPENAKVFGFPAKPEAIAKRINACVQRLPKLYKTINGLKQKIAELEEQINGRKTTDNKKRS